MKMKTPYSPDEEKLFSTAISFLVENFNKTGHNPKPVILHSTRVAMYLYNQHHSANVVVAAFLHDLLEDTEVKIEEIESEFGGEVARLVLANSFKREISDYREQFLETFKRNIDEGFDAVLIKASDLLANSDYYHLAEEDLKPLLFEKFSTFIDLAEGVLKNTQVLADLYERKGELIGMLKIN